MQIVVYVSEREHDDVESTVLAFQMDGSESRENQETAQKRRENEFVCMVVIGLCFIMHITS